MILQLVKVEISLHWHRNFTVPTMYLIFYRKSRNRHHTYIPCLSLLASSHLRSQVSSSWQSCRFLPLPCSLICRKGVSIRHWRKENAGRHGLRTTASGTSPLRFRTYWAAIRYATDISRAVSRRKTSPTYGSKENRRTPVTFLRDLWTISHF